jgi:hypothetical protein
MTEEKNNVEWQLEYIVLKKIRVRFVQLSMKVISGRKSTKYFCWENSRIMCVVQWVVLWSKHIVIHLYSTPVCQYCNIVTFERETAERRWKERCDVSLLLSTFLFSWLKCSRIYCIM